MNERLADALCKSSEIMRMNAELQRPHREAAADQLRASWLIEMDWRCGYCGKPAARVNRCADHVLPLSRSGKHTPENLKRACRSCNSRKGKQAVWFA